MTDIANPPGAPPGWAAPATPGPRQGSYMPQDAGFWVVVSVTMTGSLLMSAAIGYFRRHWSLLIAILILSTLALGAGAGISVAYGGYLGVIFIPAILVGYVVGRALDENRALDEV